MARKAPTQDATRVVTAAIGPTHESVIAIRPGMRVLMLRDTPSVVEVLSRITAAVGPGELWVESTA